MVATKCENLHGHNWHIEVRIAGKELNAAGVLIDFGIFKQHIKDVMDLLDHKFLNELEYFNHANPPSSENIARFIADDMEARLAPEGVHVSSVTAWESEDACATYFVS
jgi:6-pyruvoyltetrahydropterin/6-carboxytetrahydropterin synthase